MVYLLVVLSIRAYAVWGGATKVFIPLIFLCTVGTYFSGLRMSPKFGISFRALSLDRHTRSTSFSRAWVISVRRRSKGG